MAEAKVVLKPKFLGVISVLPVAINSVIGGVGMLAFGFFANHVSRGGIPMPIEIVFGAAFVLFVFVIPIVAYVLKKNTYSQTEYRLYGDHLEYAEGFLNVENKSINFDKIQETRMTRGILQKKYGVGTIALMTAGHNPNAGIYLKDIESPESIYDTVKQILSHNNGIALTRKNPNS